MVLFLNTKKVPEREGEDIWLISSDPATMNFVIARGGDNSVPDIT